MYSVVYITAIFAAVTARKDPARFKDWKGYKEGDRFFYMAADDGETYRVDSSDEVDEEAISNHTCCPVNNGYWVYTIVNPEEKDILIMGDEESVLKSYFNPRKQTVFISHGWTGDGNSEMNVLLTKALLKTQDVNVIVLDWSNLAKKNYVTARFAAPKVGRMLGKFIKWLQEAFDVYYDDIHLVGHGLGAHVVGNAGKELNGRAKRITGLDPAGPLWYTDKRHRIAKTDARYVEVIHTNNFACGYPFRSGHADFYPNGGTHMVGCHWWDIKCHHQRSWRYMAASIEQDMFYSNKCKGLVQAWRGKCTGKQEKMGNNHIHKQMEGIWGLKTTANYPYIPQSAH